MNLTGTVLMTLFWFWHCPPQATHMAANFIPTGESLLAGSWLSSEDSQMVLPKVFLSSPRLF